MIRYLGDATKNSVIDRALVQLNVISGQYVPECRILLTDLLNEFEMMAYWRFLEVTATITATSNSFAFSATTPVMTIGGAGTPFSKGLSIAIGLGTSSAKNLREISKPVFDELNDGTAGSPQFFCRVDQTVYLYPVPTSSALTLTYFRTMPKLDNPTAPVDADDLQTVNLIPTRYHQIIANYGLPAILFSAIDDERANPKRQEYLQYLSMMAHENKDYYTQYKSMFDKFTLDSRNSAPEQKAVNA